MHVASAIAGEQHDNARVTVVIQAVFEHTQLKPLIGHPLFTLVACATVKQINFDASVLHPVPELLHFRRNGRGGSRPSHGAVGVG